MNVSFEVPIELLTMCNTGPRVSCGQSLLGFREAVGVDGFGGMEEGPTYRFGA
jgi:hypothetical protein